MYAVLSESALLVYVRLLSIQHKGLVYLLLLCMTQLEPDPLFLIICFFCVVLSMLNLVGDTVN
jgi:hypothetical protein